MKTRVIGLGNSILTDDGVGIVVVSELQKTPQGGRSTSSGPR